MEIKTNQIWIGQVGFVQVSPDYWAFNGSAETHPSDKVEQGECVITVLETLHSAVLGPMVVFTKEFVAPDKSSISKKRMIRTQPGLKGYLSYRRLSVMPI